VDGDQGHMKKNTEKMYVGGLSVLALGIVSLAFVGYGDNVSVLTILLWCVLGIAAETLCLYSPSEVTVSVAMAIYLCVIILTNPFVAVLVTAVSVLLRWTKDKDGKGYFFSFKISSDVYNLTSHVITIGVAAYLYQVLMVVSDTFLWVSFVALIVLTVAEVLNILLIVGYFKAIGQEADIPIFKSVMGALPSAWLVGGLGLGLAYAQINYGVEIVAIFIIPILLARYVFKLYFDILRQAEEIINAFIESLELRDTYTSGHTERVEKYTVMLARWLNYKGQQLEEVKKAARLHDIGKIGIPDSILNKEGPLTDAEYELIRSHPAMGGQILGKLDHLKHIAKIIRAHHEREDGKGYPDGLAGDEIPEISAMLSIADSFDAMTSDRPYRLARTRAYAMSEIRAYRGTQFHARLADVFLDNIEDYLESIEDHNQEEKIEEVMKTEIEMTSS